MTENDLTVAQAAKELGVFPSTLVRWINTDLFPGAYKLNPTATNSPYRIPRRDVDNFRLRRQGAIKTLEP